MAEGDCSAVGVYVPGSVTLFKSQRPDAVKGLRGECLVEL